MVKINTPKVPPSAAGQNQSVQNQTSKVANTLAGLVGGSKETLKKAAADKSKEAERKEQMKKLAEFGKKCKLKKDMNAREATQCIVQGVLEDEYDSSENGFDGMVETIVEFIQEQSDELRERFNGYIDQMKETLD